MAKRNVSLPEGTPMLDMNDPNFAAKLGEAIGAQPGDTIQFVTPQFHREKGAPAVHPAPEPFERVLSMDYNDLLSLGCRPWDEPDAEGRVLLLLPGEWYQCVPEGFTLHCIDGAAEPFARGKTDDDIRFGCLAYGLLVKKAERRG